MIPLALRGLASILPRLLGRVNFRGEGLKNIFRGEVQPYNMSKTSKFMKSDKFKPGDYYSTSLDDALSYAHIPKHPGMISFDKSGSLLSRGVPIIRSAKVPEGRIAEGILRGGLRSGAGNYVEMAGFKAPINILRTLKENISPTDYGLSSGLPRLLENIKNPETRNILLKLLMGGRGLKSGGSV